MQTAKILENRANITCSQAKGIEYCQPPWQLVGAAVLCHLLVSDVEGGGYKEGSNVYKLAEDAALRWAANKAISKPEAEFEKDATSCSSVAWLAD